MSLKEHRPLYAPSPWRQISLRRVTEVRCVRYSGGILARKTYYTCTESKINDLHAPTRPSPLNTIAKRRVCHHGSLVEVHLQSFSTSVLNRHKWLASNSGRFIARYTLNMIWVGPSARLDIVKGKVSFP
jgi:hypothetical protein